jgi:hypothetical protein
MNTITRQTGVTFSGFIMIAAILVSVAIFGMKLIPSYMENGKIQKAMDAIVKDPAMQTATIAEIQQAFYKRALAIDNVTSVSENDLEISKEGGKLEISAKYNAKIPVAGNVYLLIEFNPKAPK